MKYTSLSYQLQLLYGAYERLKEWFDPAFYGSPYEANLPPIQPQRTKRVLLLKKRLMIRF